MLKNLEPEILDYSSEVCRTIEIYRLVLVRAAHSPSHHLPPFPDGVILAKGIRVQVSDRNDVLTMSNVSVT
jgi:hypothetical protein